MDGELLLKAIQENPADDHVRLIYADWLDETTGMVTCPKCIQPLFSSASSKVIVGNTQLVLTSSPVSSVSSNSVTIILCDHCKNSGRIPDGRANLAELIRIQIELHNKPCHAFMYSCHENGADRCECNDSEHFNGLRERESSLIAAYPNWKPVCPACNGTGTDVRIEVPGFPNAGRLCVSCSGTGRVGTFKRGFIKEVPVRIKDVCTLAPWCLSSWASQVLYKHPVVEFICVDEPWQEDGTDNDFAWWEIPNRDTPEYESGVCPNPLFELMWAEYPKCRKSDHLGRWLLWQYRVDAVDAMSWALTEYARRESR